MSQCSGCGEPLVAGLKFCTRCGQPAAVANGVRCAQCGTQQAAGKRFCVSCGAPISVTAAGPAMASAPAPPMAVPAVAPPPPGGIPRPAMMPPPANMLPQSGFGGAGPMQQSPAMAAPKRGNSGMLVAILLLLIVAALGIGGYLAYRHLSSSPSDNESAATGEAPAVAAGGRETRPGTPPARGSVRREDQTGTSRGANQSTVPSSQSVRQPPQMEATFGDTADAPSGSAPATAAGSSTGSTPPSRATGGGTPANDAWSDTTASGNSESSSSAATHSPPVAASPAPTAASTAPHGWGIPETSQNNPAPAPPMASTGNLPGGPASGILIWSGPLRKNGVITIDGNTASVGRVQGELPGVPVRIETDFRDVGFSESPSRSNGWKRFSMRGKMNGNVVITLRWRTLR